MNIGSSCVKYLRNRELTRQNYHTQTPDRAISRTAGSSVNSKDKDPNPRNKVAASATPVTPPICRNEDTPSAYS
jgi:hypothetical protein